mgnify:CR=1 FL=1
MDKNAEDPLKLLGFKQGGNVDPLQNLGFTPRQDYRTGGLVTRQSFATGGTVTATAPVKIRPQFPTHKQILVEAEKIYYFVQQK